MMISTMMITLSSQISSKHLFFVAVPPMAALRTNFLPRLSISSGKVLKPWQKVRLSLPNRNVMQKPYFAAPAPSRTRSKNLRTAAAIPLRSRQLLIFLKTNTIQKLEGTLWWGTWETRETWVTGDIEEAGLTNSLKTCHCDQAKNGSDQ